MVRQEGLVVFVPGALPGETIEYTVGPVKKGFARGVLRRVVKASADRRPAPCPLYGRCGGCDLMHLSDEAQPAAKALLVQEAFRRLGKKEIELPEVVSGPAWGYRARMQLHKDRPGAPAGFKARGSDKTIAVRACPVAVPSLAPLLASGGAEVPVGRTNVFGTEAGAFWEGRDRRVTVEVAGKRLALALDGFFQSNLALLPSLLSHVLELLSAKGDRVLDLYGGAGLFGAFLADRFATVVEVEQNGAALALAKENVVGPLHEFHESTLEAWVARQPKAAAPLDAIVVDPPRLGLSDEVRGWLARRPAPVLVYVSCNPDTLARDTRGLEAAGWRLDSLKVFDFYPQTAHAEAVARFVHP